ncbi:biotin--[acetyl-CoA-carboxylase] ligase [Pseudogracilibacillus sp. SE30717A]|uniref:biotin--[acetyl-CoA-carboxylase] ligase n=1 Tax=Pseudogracilibacillus sp. SE30717A TaxID=3098293 RepID=UPI00300DFB30
MSSTRNKLIELLSKNEAQYISGQLLSEQLNISRSAIWKHMNELKKDGYEIEGKAKKGYRIISYPNKISENTISWGLQTDWLGKKIVYRDSITSTQRLAHELALDGAEHGTIVIADEQTKGKGRVDRNWHSQKGKGIWMSVILRPTILPYLAPQLTLLTATVLANVIDQYAKIKPQIKWPNDILIDSRKMAGILTEMQAEQDHVLYVIVGMGININQDQSDLPDDILNKATSLRIETGQEWEMLPMIQQIIETFESKYMHYIDNGFKEVKQNWENYGFRLNERLQINSGNKRWEGLFLGIAEDGALLAKTDTGIIEKVYSGEISWF